MKKPHLLITSLTGPGLNDLTATLGFNISTRLPAMCTFLAQRDEGLLRGRAWLILGWMDPARALPPGQKGIVALQAYADPTPYASHDPGLREVMVILNGDGWQGALASVLAAGFEPAQGPGAFLKADDHCVYLSGRTRSSDDALRAVSGVQEVSGILNVDAGDPRLHGSTNTGISRAESTKSIDEDILGFDRSG